IPLCSIERHNPSRAMGGAAEKQKWLGWGAPYYKQVTPTNGVSMPRQLSDCARARQAIQCPSPSWNEMDRDHRVGPRPPGGDLRRRALGQHTYAEGDDSSDPSNRRTLHTHELPGRNLSRVCVGVWDYECGPSKCVLESRRSVPPS